ncbi:kinase-like domain-containing protein [Mycena belliarum]|uniref:non-specific serine/threonine protein kinase n=1 Tax=Mycena belliarum TaxID=1033014 RepID=A0AAD6UF56_9AGAR|nr:kinase-like domain-containing protein [Mycena belliae]
MPASDSLPNLLGHLVDEGRLRLLYELGSGSYGVVYKALDTTSPPDAPTYYAVKCLGFGSSQDEREIDLHTVCSTHPSVTTLHRRFYTHGCLCVVLELSTSELWAAIDDGVFRNNNALVKKTFLKILDAVRFCHQRGIHHRDLKPENILCRADGSEIRIADFGLAVDDELPCSTAAGTPGYMTPESLSLCSRTDSYEPAQSDTWACCVTLLNMMSGMFPWRKAVDSDKGWNAFITDDYYLRRRFPISDPLNDLLERCFRPVAPTRPTLLQLRFEIANMKDLFRVAADSVTVPAPRFLAVPFAHGSSAPSTPGASFSFNASDYPSTLPSNATSISIELNPVRLSEAACDKESRAPPPSTVVPAHATAIHELLARLDACPPPLLWLSPVDSAPKDAPPFYKKPTRNPLRRLCRWIKQARLGSA